MNYQHQGRMVLVSLAAVLVGEGSLLAKDPIVLQRSLNNRSSSAWQVRAMVGPTASKGSIRVIETNQGGAGALLVGEAAKSSTIDFATDRDADSLFLTLKANTNYTLRYEADQDGNLLQYLKFRPANPASDQWTTLKVQLLGAATGTPKLAILRAAYSDPDFKKINKPAKVTGDYDNVVQLSSLEPGSMAILKDQYVKP